MVQISEMAHDEKVHFYMKSTKKKLAEMLIECNRMLDIRRQEESIITQDKASSTTASYHFHEPTRREKIATFVLAGLLANPERDNTIKFIINNALNYTDKLIKQLDEKK